MDQKPFKGSFSPQASFLGEQHVKAWDVWPGMLFKYKTYKGFCVRNRNYGLGWILCIWVLGHLGSGVGPHAVRSV